jgi:hypothetical protein
MKSFYDKPVTTKEALRIGEKAAKVNFQMAIDRYNREELPKIQASYAKMFILVLAAEFGFGKRRLRRALNALAKITCDVHNLIVDGVFNDVYDIRLKNAGLWDVYQEFANGECRQIGDSEYYEPIQEDEE